MKYHCWLMFPVALLVGGDVPGKGVGLVRKDQAPLAI